MKTNGSYNTDLPGIIEWRLGKKICAFFGRGLCYGIGPSLQYIACSFQHISPRLKHFYLTAYYVGSCLADVWHVSSVYFIHLPKL